MRAAFFFALVAFPAVAQESKERDACFDAAMTQSAMNICASEEFRRADAALNAIYAKVLTAAASEPGAVAKIKTSERTWIRYRAEYMEAMFPAKDKQLNYGSVFPMNHSLVMASLTWRQVDALKTLLNEYTVGLNRSPETEQH